MRLVASAVAVVVAAVTVTAGVAGVAAGIAATVATGSEEQDDYDDDPETGIPAPTVIAHAHSPHFALSVQCMRQGNAG